MFDKGLFALPGAVACSVRSALISVAVALITVGQAISLGWAIVEVWSGHPVSSVGGLLVVFALCFIARRVLSEVGEGIACSFADATQSRLTEELKGAAWASGPALIDGMGCAGFATLLADGMDDVRDYLAITIPKALNMVLIPALLVIALFAFDALSGAIALICYPFIILFMQLIGRGAKEEAARTHDGFLTMANHYMDSVRGLRTLKSFGRSRAHAERVMASSEAYRLLTMRNLKIGTLSSTILDIFATCGLAAIAIMLGFRLVEGGIAFFPALVVLMLVPEYFTPIKAYAKDYHATLDGKAAYARVCELLTASKSRDEHTRALVESERLVQEEALTPFKDVKFSELGFCYPGASDIALKGISGYIRAGMRVGVVGPSGSGKSTFLNLLAGLADPSCGNIALNGQPLCTLRRSAWRRQVCYIPQDPFILSASVRENVAFYASCASDERIKAILEEVGLPDLACDEGLDLKLGDGGHSLSGGEAQRICIARALLDEERTIWILDEPTARLDAQTSSALIASVVRCAQGRALVVATHSSAWHDFFDEVIDLGTGGVR